MSKTVDFQPYVGPKPFEEAEKDLFFGREGEANDLFSLIIAHPAVLVYAQSGAGKTSLINAKIVPSLKLQAYEVLPVARVQGIETEKASNIYVFNTLISWADGESQESPELARMSLAEFLRRRPHVQKVRDFAVEELVNNAQADDEEALEAEATEQEPTEEEPEEAKALWELPRVAVFDQFEELFTSYPHRWQEREAFFEQIREALDDDYLLRVVFLMREDYIAELDPYVSLLPGNLRVRMRLERLGEKSALDAVVKPLQFTNRKFGKDVALALVHNLMKSSNGRPGMEQFVEAVQLQVVCQNLWQSLKPADTTITLTHLEECGDVKQALMSFYEKSIKTIVGENGLADGEGRITEGDLRRWFEKVLITPEKKRATVYRAERTGGMPNDTIIVPLERVQLIKGEWRAGARWYELSHDRFIEPILTSNQMWLEKQSLAEQILQRLEIRAVEYTQGGSLLNQDELLDAKRLQANQRQPDIAPSAILQNLIQASLVPGQKRRQRVMSLGLAALVIVLLAVSASAYVAVNQWIAAESAKSQFEDQKNTAEQLLRSTKAAWEEARAQEAIATEKLDEAQRAKKEADTQREEADIQRREAEQAKVDARNAEDRAKQESKAAREFGAEATERTLVAEGEKLIATNKDWTSGGLLLIQAAELDKRLEKKDAVSISELLQLKEGAAKVEASSLLQQLKEDTLTHRAREIVRRNLPELSRRPAVLKADEGAEPSAETNPREVNAVAVSPNGNHIVLITRRSRAVSEEADVGSGASVWKVEPRSGPRVEADEEPNVAFKHILATPRAVVSAAFSHDSQYLLTGGADNKGRIWDSTGKELAVLEGHTAPIRAVAFAPGRTDWAITISEDKNTLLWHWPSKSDRLSPKVLSGHEGSVNALALDPKGKYLATEAADETARLWNLREITEGKAPISIKLMGLRGPFPALAFNPDGDRLVTEGKLACGADVALVWDVDKIWKTLGSLEEKERFFDPDPEKAQNCQPSTKLAIPGAVSVLRGHRGGIASVNFSQDGELIVTASADETARIWNASSGDVVAELRGHTAPLNSATFDPNDRYVVTSALDKTARLWDREGNNLSVLRGHRNRLLASELSADGEFIVTASTDGTARVWATPKEHGLPERGVTELRGHTDGVYSVAFSRDGKLLLTGSFDGTGRLWHPQTGQPRKDSFVATKAAFNREGDLIVTASGNFALVRSSANEGKELARLPHQEWTVFSAAFSANSKYIVTASRLGNQNKGMVKVWQKLTENSWEVQAEIPQSNYLFSAEFNPTNDQRLVTAGLDGKVRIWKKESRGWSLLDELPDHRGPVISANFSSDGKYIVTASADRTAIVWRETEPDTWENSFWLRGHKGPVYSAAFSADGNYIVTASGDKTAGVWKKAEDGSWSWDLVSVLTNQEDMVFGAAFSSDGELIATAGAEGRARIYSRVMFEPFADVLKKALKLKPYLCRLQEGQSSSVFCADVIGR